MEYVIEGTKASELHDGDLFMADRLPNVVLSLRDGAVVIVEDLEAALPAGELVQLDPVDLVRLVHIEGAA